MDNPFLFVLSVLALLCHANGDYSCLCNYAPEIAIFGQPSSMSKLLGYMYEYDCNEVVVTSQDANGWHTIAVDHQPGYVQDGPQVVIQNCDGNPPLRDALTTPISHLTKPGTSTFTSSSASTIKTQISEKTPVVFTHSTQSIPMTSTPSIGITSGAYSLVSFITGLSTNDVQGTSSLLVSAATVSTSAAKGTSNSTEYPYNTGASKRPFSNFTFTENTTPFSGNSNRNSSSPLYELNTGSTSPTNPSYSKIPSFVSGRTTVSKLTNAFGISTGYNKSLLNASKVTTTYPLNTTEFNSLSTSTSSYLPFTIHPKNTNQPASNITTTANPSQTNKQAASSSPFTYNSTLSFGILTTSSVSNNLTHMLLNFTDSGRVSGKNYLSTSLSPTKTGYSTPTNSSSQSSKTNSVENTTFPSFITNEHSIFSNFSSQSFRTYGKVSTTSSSVQNTSYTLTNLNTTMLTAIRYPSNVEVNTSTMAYGTGLLSNSTSPYPGWYTNMNYVRINSSHYPVWFTTFTHNRNYTSRNPGWFSNLSQNSNVTSPYPGWFTNVNHKSNDTSPYPSWITNTYHNVNGTSRTIPTTKSYSTSLYGNSSHTLTTYPYPNNTVSETSSSNPYNVTKPFGSYTGGTGSLVINGSAVTMLYNSSHMQNTLIKEAITQSSNSTVPTATNTVPRTKTTVPTTTTTIRTTTTTKTTTTTTTLPTTTRKIISGNISICPTVLYKYTTEDVGALNQYDDRCLELVTRRIIWTKAESDCQAKGGHLMYIESQRQQAFVYKWLKTFNFNDPVWIGLTNLANLTEFRWISGKSLYYTNWYPAPIKGSTEHCVVMVPRPPENGAWRKVDCGYTTLTGDYGHEHSFICEYSISRTSLSMPGSLVG